MKKILSAIIIIAVTMCTLVHVNVVNATTAITAPEYDSTFNDGKGIFYANGNNVEIIENSLGQTVATFNGGSVVLPSTATVVGGGKEGTSFDETNITITSGTVSLVYGGGASLIEASPAIVNNAHVKVNGGNVLATVYGGGLMYTTTNETDVTINSGNISAICAGGAASSVISGVAYSAGSEDNLKASKNRTNDAQIILNGGIVGDTSRTGTLFGGGQGYSFVGETSVIINDRRPI